MSERDKGADPNLREVFSTGFGAHEWIIETVENLALEAVGMDDAVREEFLRRTLNRLIRKFEEDEVTREQLMVALAATLTDLAEARAKVYEMGGSGNA